MVQPVPMNTPVPPPVEDWSGNLRDVIDTQQQTIKFLLGQWDAMLQQVGLGGGSFGEPVVYAVDSLIPSGWWQTLVPAVPGTAIGTVTIGSTAVTINSGQFWSDGNVKITLSSGVTVARVASMQDTP